MIFLISLFATIILIVLGLTTPGGSIISKLLLPITVTLTFLTYKDKK